MLSLKKLSSLKINLDANEYYFSSHLNKSKIINSETIQKNLYPRNALLHEKLLTKLSKHYNINPKNIIITNGSQNAIDATFRTQKGRIIIASPTFSLVENIAKVNDREFSDIQILSLSDIPFFVSEIYLIQPDTVYISNPSTPFGIILDKKIIENLLIDLPNTIFIIDEAYIEYTDEKYSALSLINTYSNLIITRTFSKFYGSPNLRIGYLICNNNNKFKDKIKNICSNINVTDFSRLNALECLENFNHYKYNTEFIKLIQKYLSDELTNSSIPHHISPNLPSFIIYNKEPQILTMILQYKFNIIVNPINNILAIRVTISTKDNMILFISALKESLDLMKNNIIELPIKIYDSKHINNFITINEPFMCNIDFENNQTENENNRSENKNNSKDNTINAEISNFNINNNFKNSQIHNDIIQLGFEYDKSMKMTGRKKDSPLHRDGTNKLNILHQITGDSCEFIIIPEEECHKIKKQSLKFNNKNELFNLFQNNNIRVILSTKMNPGNAIIFQSEFPHAVIFPGITTFINHTYKNTIREMMFKDDISVY